MSIFGKNNGSDHSSSGAIPYGKEKSSGGHDHRTNKGGDRTPSQKQGDEKRKK